MIPTLQLGGAGRARYHAPAGGGDPYFANVKLLLHMDGSDNGTTFTDVTGKTVTSANAVTKTGEKKFGTASGYFDGTGDYLTVPYATADFRWWDTDFTIEAWIYPISTLDLQASTTIPGLIGNCSTGASAAYWAFGPMNDRKVRFFYWRGSEVSIASTELVTADAWNHIAMTHKSGSGIKLWVNGIGTASYTAVVATPQDSTGWPLTIGRCFGGDIKAYVDEVRITKGVERYTADFTPPTAAFPDA
jgi:hypothetical protein